MPKIVIHEYQRTAQYFREDLGNDIQLDLLTPIPLSIKVNGVRVIMVNLETIWLSVLN
ncbi:MAG: hypothetical protein RLZZ203_972 [Cyanobacteriota bacterium]|jgi:hypothetical protein